MEHPSIPHPSGFFGVVEEGCGYTERTFDPNLIAALDKLGETYGPQGVALAAATRTEPEALSRVFAATFSHQRELWQWLVSERYQAQPGRDRDLDVPQWQVVDTDARIGELAVVASIDSGPNGIDAEDSARAMAQHLNNKITLARVAQAVADTADTVG
jgi:hypothetical protein